MKGEARPEKVVVCGIGNRIRGDDAALRIFVPQIEIPVEPRGKVG